MKIQQTTSITIDEATFEVADLSPEIQQMVQYLDDWRQKEANTTSSLLMIRGALRDIQNTLLTAIQKSQSEVATDAATGGQVPSEPTEG